MRYTLAQHPVVKDFMAFTKFTTPYGTEDATFKNVLVSRGFAQDENGNYSLTIGDSRTLFLAHLDTADRTRQRVKRVVTGSDIETDKTTILGADDKAGVAVILHLVRNHVPGYYVFVLGEEVGRIGSIKHAAELGEWEYDRVICWDRYGYDSIITHQMGERSCSDEFAAMLSEEYAKHGVSLDPDDGGIYTDSYSYHEKIPECTNISVGYFNQHTTSELQDAEFLVQMAEASILVDWETLPVYQDLYTRESSWAMSGGRRNNLYYDDIPSSKAVRYGSSDAPWENNPWDDREMYSALSEDEIEHAALNGLLTFPITIDFVKQDPEGSARMLYEFLTGCRM